MYLFTRWLQMEKGIELDSIKQLDEELNNYYIDTKHRFFIQSSHYVERSLKTRNIDDVKYKDLHLKCVCSGKFSPLGQKKKRLK